MTNKIWLTADLHFHHSNVIKYCDRPFSSVEEMNEALITKWNSVVGPEDTVYMLGDFSMAFRSVETMTPRLNGIKYIVPGNHDFCHSYHKKSRKEENRQKWIQKYQEYGWTVLPEQTYINLPVVGKVLLCHMPYLRRDSSTFDDKYENWRPEDKGLWLLHGHVHEKWKVKDHMINVGVDVWDYTPVSSDQIIEIIKESYHE